MARKVKDSELDSRASRSKLKARGKPYWRTIERSAHIGYRRLKGKAGTWWGRFYVGNQEYAVEALGAADDLSDADGVEIFDYWQAVEDLRKRRKQRAASGAGLSAPMKVYDVVAAYVAERDARELRRRGRAIRSDASHRLCRYLLGTKARGKKAAVPPAKLAAIELPALAEDHLTKWRAGLPATLKPSSQRRLLNDLRAALNGGVRGDALEKARLRTVIKDGLKANGSAYDDDPEPVVRESQILTDAQVARVLHIARDVDDEGQWEGDLYRMTVALAATGARFSQAARIRVNGYQRARRRMMVPKSRKGKGKAAELIPVPVGADVLDALLPAATGRAGSEMLLERWRHKQIAGSIRWVRDRRGPWQSPSEFDRAWRTIRQRAKLSEQVVAYSLRHTSIVRGLRANLPVELVAKLHDTSAQMIRAHYAHWIAHGLEDLAAQAVVPLLPSGKKVVRLAGRA